MHWLQTTALQHPSCSLLLATKEDGSDRGQFCRRLWQSHLQGPISIVRWLKAQPLKSGSTTQELCNLGQDL